MKWAKKRAMWLAFFVAPDFITKPGKCPDVICADCQILRSRR